MSGLLKSLGLASEDQNAKLEQALLDAAEKVIASIILPGLDQRQNLELQQLIRAGLKDDKPQQIREAFRLAVSRIESLCHARLEVARIESELKALRELELFDVGAKDEAGLLARAIQRERIEVAGREMEAGKDALSAAREHLQSLQAAPLTHQPKHVHTPEPWPRTVQYLQHREGAFEPEPDEEEGWDTSSEFTDSRIRRVPRA